MTITHADVTALEARVNQKLASHNAAFVMTVHFSYERLNDVRNNPAISLGELESLFERVIAQHMLSIVALNHGDTFNIRCMQSHINMPCAVQKQDTKIGAASHKNIVITVMRKERWFSKDPYDFKVA